MSGCRAAELGRSDDLVETCRETPTETGARITLTDDVDEGVKGVDFLYTDVWVSMGEDRGLGRAHRAAQPYQVNTDVIAGTGNPNVKFMHCLPAFHNRETKVGEEIFEEFGIDCMEVTDEVFESRPRSSSIRPRTACTRSRPSWSRPSATDGAGMRSSSPSAATRCSSAASR